jgi:membrane protease subunit HflC
MIARKHWAAIALGLFLAALLVTTQALFIVSEGEQALVLRFGQPIGAIRGPGLHTKTPFIETVRRFDARILAVDPPPKQVMIAASSATPADAAQGGKEPLLVDAFMRYRITDPLRYLSTLRTDANARNTLTNILVGEMRAEMGRTTLTALLSPERTRVMQAIANRVGAQMTSARYGVEMVDVRIVRADLTAQLLGSTLQRMRSAFQKQATQTRAEGEEAALKIRAEADKTRTLILAEAERKAQVLRGQGDEEATRIYAAAFNEDPEFYAFWRSMEAYRTALADPSKRLILSPEDVRFFDALKKGSAQ